MLNKRKILYCHGGNIAIAGYSLIVGTNWHYRDWMQRRLASKGELHAVGLTDATTSFGNTVRVYDMERTICDIVRSRSTMETQVYQDALKQYSRRKDKNLHRLMDYAKAFRVEKMVREYMGILL